MNLPNFLKDQEKILEFAKDFGMSYANMISKQRFEYFEEFSFENSFSKYIAINVFNRIDFSKFNSKPNLIFDINIFYVCPHKSIQKSLKFGILK